MDQRSENREFLASRRLPGLRREEVALLAGVPVHCYTQMERGNLHGVSDTVLEAVAGGTRPFAPGIPDSPMPTAGRGTPWQPQQ
jgi:hypothetical protein